MSCFFMDNIRAALDWFHTDHTGSDSELLAVLALYPYWSAHGAYLEGYLRMRDALDRNVADPPGLLRQEVLLCAGNLICLHGELTAARQMFEEAHSVAELREDQSGIARSILGLGETAYHQGEILAARSLYEEGLALVRTQFNNGVVSTTLERLAIIAIAQGDFHAARIAIHEALVIHEAEGNMHRISDTLASAAYLESLEANYSAATRIYERSLAIAREIQNPRVVAFRLWSFGNLAIKQKQLDLARHLLDESIQICRSSGIHNILTSALYSAALACTDQGELQTAIAFLTERLALSRQHRDRRNIRDWLELAARIVYLQGHPERACKLLGAAEAISEALAYGLRMPDDRAYYEQTVVKVRDALDPGAFARHWAYGRTQTIDQAIAISELL